MAVITFFNAIFIPSWHLRHSPVSSPTEELQKDKRRIEDERGPGLDFILCAAVVRIWLPLIFILLLVCFIINVFKCSPVPFFSYLQTVLQTLFETYFSIVIISYTGIKASAIIATWKFDTVTCLVWSNTLCTHFFQVTSKVTLLFNLQENLRVNFSSK